MSDNDLIITKIDAFIRKYYKNRMIKGIICVSALLFAFFLVAVLSENFGYFSTTVRTVIFWLYIAVALFFVAFYIIVPLAKMHRIGKVLDREQAAVIIGEHFPEIGDKLLNLLQLKTLSETQDSDLLLASIEQKTAALSPLPFRSAVDLKQNRKYLKYLIIPLLAIVVLLIAAPTLITSPSERILHHGTFYEKPAPFAFELLSHPLQAVKQEDFPLQVEIVGNSLPDEVFVVVGKQSYKMRKDGKTTFSYLLKNVQKTMQFHFEAVGVQSQTFELEVFPKPLLLNFDAKLVYPAYTGRQAEVLSNIGDFTVPEGTAVQWSFQTQFAENLCVIFDSTAQNLTPDQNGRLSFAKRLFASQRYGFFTSNSYVKSSDTLLYAITTIPDVAPMIAVSELRDSLRYDRVFFRGQIKDDYGFSKLTFNLVKTAADSAYNTVRCYPLALDKGFSSQEFYYALNVSELDLQMGENITYYFEVWDNDGIHGPKSARSQMFEIRIPSEQEVQNQIDANNESIQNAGEQSMSEIKKTQQEIDELMRKLVDKKELNWQDKKDLEQLAKKQKQLKEDIARMQEQIRQNNAFQQQFHEQTQSILEKQRQLEQLFQQLMTDEMKELMKEIDKLLNDSDKAKLQEALENIKLKNEDIEKQLDQNLELMKRLEAEKMVENAIQKAEELAQKQRDLAKESEKASKKDAEKLSQKQEQLGKEFKELQQSLDKAQEQFRQLEDSPTLRRDKSLEKQIESQQNNAKENLGKGKNKNASQNQNQAADDLDKLSNQLAESMVDMEQEDLAEDVEAIRQLLKNIVTLSFNQEELIDDLNKTYIQDVKYQTIINRQNRIKSDFVAVEDSLRAIAKRQIKVAPMISKEVSAINTNISYSLRDLLRLNQNYYGQSKNTGASRSMQYAVTSLNNLALVLAESLDQMQQQMRQNNQQKKSGSCKKSGTCNNPSQGNSGKKPSPKTMKQLQDALNKQLEALKKQIDSKGKQQGGSRQNSEFSEQFAKMVSQQEQIRRMMQQYADELKQSSAGQAGKELDDIMQKMEQTEHDLVNKTITEQTLMRQQQIMTRLLEHEKAQMQREKDDRRQSTEAHEVLQLSKPDLEKYKQLKDKSIETLNNSPAPFTDFYRKKVNDYFYNTDNK